MGTLACRFIRKFYAVLVLASRRDAGLKKPSNSAIVCTHDALVVQRTGHEIADLVIEVRFLSRAPNKISPPLWWSDFVLYLRNRTGKGSGKRKFSRGGKY